MSQRDEEHENSGGVKVVDKRRFDSDGSTRSEATPPSNTSQPDSAHSAATQSTANRSNDTPGSSQSKARSGTQSSQERRLPQTTDFSSFIVGLATQALMMLGEMPHPETQRPMLNIDGARQTIDLLALMEEKTRGNLTADEDKLLGEILASLRMAFVAKVKG